MERNTVEKQLHPSMKASDFECRHQRLLHNLIVGAACLTYLMDRDDVVWRFVKDSATPHRLERFAFVVAILFIGVGAGVCTWARARRQPVGMSGATPYLALDRPRHRGDLCYAIGLGSLFPLLGFVILVAGESLRTMRLTLRENELARNPEQHSLRKPRELPPSTANEFYWGWGRAVREETVKWGILVSMIVFVITLQDRHADVLIAASFLLGLLLNTRLRSHSAGERNVGNV